MADEKEDAMSEETLISLITILGSNEQYQSKLKEYERARKLAEEATQKAAKEKESLEQLRKETEFEVNKLRNQLEAKQKVHDGAAREAAARIEIGNRQMAEVLRVQEQNSERAKILDEQEKKLVDVEKHLDNRIAALDRQKQDYDRIVEGLHDKLKRAKAFVESMS